MKKIFIGAMLLASMTGFAQETYENANLATEDLNGTARYVGMGGAMEALGADISTIGTNPAGVGLFRRSQASLSAGFVSQPNAASSSYVDGTNASFDQIGGVWSNDMGNGHYFNFGINYHKSRNFDNILSAASGLSGASQNKLTAIKGAVLGWYHDGNDDIDAGNQYNQADYLNDYTLGLCGVSSDEWSYAEANRYTISKASKGYISDYDFNLSGNVTNRLYLGLTLGIKDVTYDCFTTYTESLLNAGQSIGSVTMEDHRRISGSGFDIKFGAIFFPIENSPFRIGVNVATPTWYDLTTSNETYMTNGLDSQYGAYDNGSINESYDFKIFTPWKFGLSLGHTVGNKLALGASYEFAGYNHIKSRIINGYDYDGMSTSENDYNMNYDTKLNLRGVSTFKLGAEYKVTPEFAVRAGYNFVTPMYKTDAYRDGTLDSPGVYYSSTTDYTNWKATNRFTLGAGYSKGCFAFDVAYQYSQTNGEFFPFMSYYDDGSLGTDCVADKVDVKNQRHQVLATLTIKL